MRWKASGAKCITFKPSVQRKPVQRSVILPKKCRSWSHRTVSAEETGSEKRDIAQKVPVLVAPEDDGTVYAERMAFEWEPVEGAEEYIINIARVNDWGLRESWFNSDEQGVTITETTFRAPERTKPGRTHYWAVTAVINGQKGEWSEVRSFTTEPEKLADEDEFSRGRFDTAVNQNYPNPFNPTTQIEFTLSEVQNVSLRVYDMAGRQVAVLVDGVREAGRHAATFNADNLASGVYFYKLVTDRQTFTRQMTLIK